MIYHIGIFYFIYRTNITLQEIKFLIMCYAYVNDAPHTIHSKCTWISTWFVTMKFWFHRTMNNFNTFFHCCELNIWSCCKWRWIQLMSVFTANKVLEASKLNEISMHFWDVFDTTHIEKRKLLKLKIRQTFAEKSATCQDIIWWLQKTKRVARPISSNELFTFSGALDMACFWKTIWKWLQIVSFRFRRIQIAFNWLILLKHFLCVQQKIDKSNKSTVKKNSKWMFHTKKSEIITRDDSTKFNKKRFWGQTIQT